MTWHCLTSEETDWRHHHEPPQVHCVTRSLSGCHAQGSALAIWITLPQSPEVGEFMWIPLNSHHLSRYFATESDHLLVLGHVISQLQMGKSLSAGEKLAEATICGWLKPLTGDFPMIFTRNSQSCWSYQSISHENRDIASPDLNLVCYIIYIHL